MNSNENLLSWIQLACHFDLQQHTLPAATALKNLFITQAVKIACCDAEQADHLFIGNSIIPYPLLQITAWDSQQHDGNLQAWFHSGNMKLPECLKGASVLNGNERKPNGSEQKLKGNERKLRGSERNSNGI